MQVYRVYTRSKKKSALINDWENIAYWEKSEESKALVDKYSSFQKQQGGLGQLRQCIPRKNLIFTRIYDWKQVLQRLNWHRIIIWIWTLAPPLHSIYCVWKTILTIGQKMTARNFKNPNFQFLCGLGKTHWKFCTYRKRFGLSKDPANILNPLCPNFKNANYNSNR